MADFNLSRRIQQHTGQTHSGSINSPQWSAPERLSGDDYSFPADVFSFGVILWELSTLSALVFFLICACQLLPSCSKAYRCTQCRQRAEMRQDSSPAEVPWRDEDEPAPPPPPGRRPQRDSFFFILRVVPNGERLPIPELPRPGFPEYPKVRLPSSASHSSW